MVFRDRNDMADFMEKSVFGDKSVQHAYLGKALEMLESVYAEELDRYMERAGLEKGKYYVDDAELKASLRLQVELSMESFASREAGVMARNFARTSYEEPVSDSYDRGGWLKDYEPEDLQANAVSFSIGYCEGRRSEIEGRIRSICSRNIASHPPMLYTKVRGDVEIVEASRLLELNEEEAREKDEHPKVDGISNYNFANIKKSVLVTTTEEKTSGYFASFSVGVKRPPVLGGAGSGVRFSVTSDKDGYFRISASNFNGDTKESVFTRDEILSMTREDFEGKALNFEIEKEHVLDSQEREA